MLCFRMYLLFVFTSHLLAQQPIWLGEVIHGRFSPQYSEGDKNYVFSDGSYYFNGWDNESGRELWRTDGTAAGTHMLSDLNPGPQDSNPRSITPTDDSRLFFLASTGLDLELHVTDGTAEGTRMVKDINTQSTVTFFGNSDLTFWNGMLYFAASDPEAGNSLWRSDGTESGTVLFKDLTATRKSTRIDRLVPYRDYLYFYAEGDDGLGLYRTDGTAEGTNMIFNGIAFDDGGGAFKGLVADQEYLYFSAVFIDRGSGLFRSDGTDAGTTLLWSPEETRTGSESNIKIFTDDSGVPVRFGNLLLFSSIIGRGFDAQYGVFGIDVEKQETALLEVFDEMPKHITPAGDKVFFYGTQEPTGTEVWVTDGSEAGTTITRDINAGSGSLQLSLPIPMGTYQGLAYFPGQDPSDGTNSVLWKSDGTEENTVVVTAASVGGIFKPNSFSQGQNIMLYSANAADSFRQNLYCLGCEAENPTSSSIFSTAIDRVSVFPNPVKSGQISISIALPNIQSHIEKVVILDIYGRVMLQKIPPRATSSTIVEAILPAGTYYLITKATSGSMGVEKLVVL